MFSIKDQGSYYYRRGRLVTRNDVRTYVAGAANESFEPWRRDFRQALFLTLIGCGSIAAAVCGYLWTESYFWFLAAAFAVACFFAADSSVQVGLPRRHGTRVESEAKRALEQVLPDDWDLLPSGYIQYVGDLDAPLRLGNNELCVVEIKSWHGWTKYLKKIKAIDQVRRQRQAFDASYAVIWLPQAPGFAEFHGDILVVGGNASHLIGQIRNIMQCYTVIQFPSEPSAEIRARIKALRFSYDPRRFLWEGGHTQSRGS